MKKALVIMVCMLYLITSAVSQTRTVSGRVTDEAGNAIQNASIVIKGTNQGVTTSENGAFTITVPNSARTLVVSFIGMGDKEIDLTSSSSYAISLSPAVSDMQDVVVVGYGTQRRNNITSSIATVKAADLENRPFTSVDQMLQGKVAGLQAPFLSGQPGAAQQIRIRGIGSVGADANPLFVIDGIIMTTGDLTQNTTTANVLAGINPNDIESVNVLKDAQATSIYGSRGANGVIVITTKRGRAGRTQIRADVEAGVNTMAPLPDAARFLNAEEWLTLLEEGVRNVGGDQSDVDFYSEYFGKGSGVDTDWRDLVTRRGSQQQYNLSASGGDTKNQFYVSGGYFKQEGVVLASDFRRYSFRTNYRHIASDKLSFSVNLGGSNSVQRTPSNGGLFANPVGALAFLRPTQNPFNADGSLNIQTDDAVTGNGNVFNGNYNPLYIAENDKNDLRSTLLQGQVGLEYSILKNLKYTSRFSVDYNNLEEYSFYNQYHGDGASLSGLGYAIYNRVFNWIATNQLDYNSRLGRHSDFRLDAKLGYEAQKSKQYDLTTGASGYPPSNQLYLLVNASEPYVVNSTASDYSFAGLYSAVTLNYLDRYVLSGSFRRDGSSRFGENNRYGNFWSVGAAWNLHQEQFMSNASFISALKLRGSYGTTGNAAIANYRWRQQMSYGATYAGSPGAVFNVIGNPNLTWESTKQADIGIEASFLDNRIGLTIDVYRRVSEDLLFENPVSPTTGFLTFTDNIGRMENKGIEIALTTSPVRGRNFRWDINFNISHNKNKILALPGGKDIIDGGFILREGHDYRTFYVREWAGVNPDNGDPQWYVDGTHQEKTSSYSAAQRQLIGSASPRFFGGLTNIMSFKGFDLQADFVFNYGNLVRDSWIVYTMDGVDPTANKYALNLQRWQKPGDITNVPRYDFGAGNNSSSFSTRFLQKGDFIKLRNITLGYTFPEKLYSRAKLTNLRIYARATNLFTVTYDDNLTVDPEQGINSANNLDPFFPRSITAGISIGL